MNDFRREGQLRYEERPEAVTDQAASVDLVRNDLFDRREGFARGRSIGALAAWYITKLIFFLLPVPWPGWLRAAILRLFGARVGKGLRIRTGVDIHFPWKLVLGDHCWIGDDTVILNLERVTLENHVALAHQVYIAAAGHDPASPTMAYKNRPVVVGKGSWIGTRAYLGPGTVIGAYSIVAAGSVVVKSVPAMTIVGGNPARVIGARSLDRLP